MNTITYRAYSGEHELPHTISLVQNELSDPYVVYTYRYFLHQWSVHAYARDVPHPVGVVVCKQSLHRERYLCGFIAVLRVDKVYCKHRIETFFSYSPLFSLLTTSTTDTDGVRTGPPFDQLCHNVPSWLLLLHPTLHQKTHVLGYPCYQRRWLRYLSGLLT
ncbi:hypothetical protein BC827DRAFT_1148353 [Russula dissimulans]|nr:hypothetical protein BC827DRAFT_1148353 [Russula dissimulans]